MLPGGDGPSIYPSCCLKEGEISAIIDRIVGRSGKGVLIEDYHDFLSVFDVGPSHDMERIQNVLSLWHHHGYMP